MLCGRTFVRREGTQMSAIRSDQVQIDDSRPGSTPARLRLAVALVACTLPELALAALGVFHPMILNNGDVEWFRTLHVLGAFLFPLVGIAPWIISRGQPMALRLVVGLTAFAYAVLYTVFDILAGLSITYIQTDLRGVSEHVTNSAETVLGNAGSDYFEGQAVAALAISVVIVIVSVIITLGAGAISAGRSTTGRSRFEAWARVVGAAAAGAVIMVGGVLFFYHHIFFPLGVVGQVLLAAGFAALLLFARASHSTVATSGN
jgi:hypothetical protein